MTEGFPRGAENVVLFPQCMRRNILFAISWISKSLGGSCDGGTPGNIPNPVVKPVSADGTRRVASRESRSPPRDFFLLNLTASAVIDENR